MKNVVLDLLTTFLHFHEATLHRHPIRLGNNQVSLLLRSPQADVCIFDFRKMEWKSRKSATIICCFKEKVYFCIVNDE